MIESIEFTNFKALKNTTLPLSPFTLLLGPNGSGKTTVLQALQKIASFAPGTVSANVTTSSHPSVWSSLLSVTASERNANIELITRLILNKTRGTASFRWQANGQLTREIAFDVGVNAAAVDSIQKTALNWLAHMQCYALDPVAIAQPVPVNAEPLQSTGYGLAGVLDNLKDNHPERWESLLAEMRHWLPEYDHIGFDRPQPGQKGIKLRTKSGSHEIPARDLSQGTLVALALLTLAYSPEPPSLIGLEEIDRGLHPRLLRNLQDALYRLSYPESCGEKRPPIQVIATTHSPYLLDLYSEHPEEVVLAQKDGLEVTMKRLSDTDHYEEILGDSPLSEVWYSGVLGGVSVKP